jgi:hypothetical protein
MSDTANKAIRSAVRDLRQHRDLWSPDTLKAIDKGLGTITEDTADMMETDIMCSSLSEIMKTEALAAIQIVRGKTILSLENTNEV